MRFDRQQATKSHHSHVYNRLRIEELSASERSLVERKRKVPRRDFKFKTVPKDFAVQGDDGQRYLESMAMIVAIGAVAGILSLLIWPIFTIPRACCGAFGGSKPRTDTGADKYSSGARKRHLAALVFVILLTGAGAALQFTGSGSVSDSLDEFFDAVVNAGEDLKTRAASISVKLAAAAELRRVQGGGGAAAPGADEALSATATLTASVDETMEQVESVRGGADKVDTVQRAVMYGLVGLGLFATLVLGGFAGLLGKRTPALAMVHLCFLVAFVAWISFGVSLALGTATADLCVDLEGFIVSNADGNNNNNNGGGGGGSGTASTSGAGSTTLSADTSGTGNARGIEQVLGCVSNGTTSDSLDFAGDEIQATARTINAELDDLGYTGPIELDPDSTDYAALEYNLTRIKADIDAGVITDDGGGAVATIVDSRRKRSTTSSESRAGLRITQSNGGVDVARLQGNVDAGLGYISVLQEIQELLECGTVREAYEGVESAICGTMLRGLDRLMIGAGLIALSLWLGVVVGARGSKRFPKENCFLPGEAESSRARKTVQPVPAYGAPGQFVELPDDPTEISHSRRKTVTREDAYIELTTQQSESGTVHADPEEMIDAAPVTGFDSQGSYIAPPLDGREF